MKKKIEFNAVAMWQLIDESPELQKIFKEEKGFKWSGVIKAANQSDTKLKTVFAEDLIPATPKQKGRPKGSKNKSKESKAKVVG